MRKSLFAHHNDCSDTCAKGYSGKYTVSRLRRSGPNYYLPSSRRAFYHFRCSSGRSRSIHHRLSAGPRSQAPAPVAALFCSGTFCHLIRACQLIQKNNRITVYVFGSSPMTISTIAPPHKLDNTIYTCSLPFSCKLSLIAFITKTGNTNPKRIPNSLIKKTIHSLSLSKSGIKKADNSDCFKLQSYPPFLCHYCIIIVVVECMIIFCHHFLCHIWTQTKRYCCL